MLPDHNMPYRQMPDHQMPGHQMLEHAELPDQGAQTCRNPTVTTEGGKDASNAMFLRGWACS